MVARGNANDDDEMEWALSVARQEQLLIDFIHSRRMAGIISDSDAGALILLRESFYRKQGIWTEPGPQDAIHSRSEVEAVVAVKRQGYCLMELWLLALYPNLKSDVSQLRRG